MRVSAKILFARAITGCRTSTRWSPNGRGKMPLSEETIRTYLTTNIHYVLDEECVEGMSGFFRMAAEMWRLAGI